MKSRIPLLLAALLAFLCIPAAAPAADAAPARAPLRPDRFAIIFNMGYAGDNLPKDPAAFEAVVRAAKDAGFNVILCQYEPWRADICKKHDMQIFVDLLVPAHHVYRDPAAAQKLCESLRSDPVVYAYHLWSDNIANTADGRSRDVANVHQWDPTHPAYIGNDQMSHADRVAGFDLFGFYDFHWKKGGHFQHLAKAADVARSTGTRFLQYVDGAPGLVGKGNANRAGYTVATSIPFGLKGYLFHYTGGVIDPKSAKLDALGEDLKKINARFAPIGPLLLSLGNPLDVYSTPITVTAKNEPTNAAPAIPAGLTAIPNHHWLQITTGEALVGLFKDPESRDIAVLANHNPYKPQTLTLTFAPARAVKQIERFDAATAKWLPLDPAAKPLTITIEDYSVTLLRVTR